MKKMKKIGIIGGTGNMGKWFAKYFRKRGHKVIAASHKTKLTPKELVEKSDAIIFSVPISVTNDVIKKYAKYAKPGSVICDFTSVKAAPVKAMLKHTKKNVEVLGMHPVFGPSEKSMKEQTIVLTPGRGKKWLTFFKKLFKSSGATITISTPEKHDKMMAIIQALNHFPTLAMGLALKEMNADLKESLKFTSPIYRTRLGLTARILSQDAELYSNILTSNPYAVSAIKSYLKAAEKMGNSVKKKDSGKFTKQFKQASAYFKKAKIKAL